MTPAVLFTCLALTAAAPDTVVVCPDAFRPALQPWVAHRQAQGHELAWVSNVGNSADIQRKIRQYAQLGALRFVVLVGDADPQSAQDAELRRRSVPTHHVPAKVNIHWGSEVDIAGDNLYGDLDGDEVPDVAVGRLPVDTPEELSRLVHKIIAYENSATLGDWRRQVNFIAGVGGFGAVVDSVLESATKKFLTDGIPPSYRTTVTYGSWRSPFCPDPRKFHDAALTRFNEGCLFWVYIGHGQRTGLDWVNTPVGQFPILSNADVSKLQAAKTPPIAVFLACYTGAFDAERDCLAEEMLRTPGGPVAVLAGSRVTMPYAMAVLGTGLMDEVFVEQRATLGEAVLHAKRRLVQESPAKEENQPAKATNQDEEADEEDAPLSRREFLDTVARAISPKPELLAEERHEHLHLFNVLGDPLLRLPTPGEVKLAVAADADAGGQLAIEGVAPHAGRLTVELICRRDRLTFQPPFRATPLSIHASLEQYDVVYAKANDHRWATQRLLAPEGAFQTTLNIPEDARGHGHVRVFLEGDDRIALGAANIYIRRPRPMSAE